MATVRETIKRDLGIRIEGVVKVFDKSALEAEMREYVVTDKIEAELRKIFDTFAYASDMLRRGGKHRDVMGIWVSGFFGSGKSHLAKVLGYLLQNDVLIEGSDERCIDTFIKHLSDTPRGKDIRLRLGEIKQTTQTKTIAFEIKSRQSLNNPNSVGEILLSEFYRHIGLSENFVVARIERSLQQRELLDKLEVLYENRFSIPWRSPGGRDDLMTVRRRLAELLPEIDSVAYPDKQSAKTALTDMFRHARITAEGIADELVDWVATQKTTNGKVQHLVFVIDEMGSFIGDSNDKIGEFNAISEMIGNKGKGKVWIVATSQQDLESVVDRTNFQPALVGRLNARFELKPHLISDEIGKVVSERILKKHPAQEAELEAIYLENEGRIAQLSDIGSTRHLGDIDERSFIDCYPFLPHQIRLAQDIFEALSGFRISGGVRSMIAVTMETLIDLADEPLGIIAGFDQMFDAVENDLLSQEYLGASGVRAIHESNARVPGTPLESGRVLKVLWLLQRIAWVPRIPETIAKLLVRNIDEDLVSLRAKVEDTLTTLQESGYVARDEATGEWKFLSEKERTIEQAIQELIRPGGPKSISLAAIRRTCQAICKSDLITKKKLANFSVSYGKTKVPFSYCVYIDGEAIDTSAELESHFISPLASGRKQTIEEIRRKNQSDGVKGRSVWCVSGTPTALENRFRRYEALVKVTADKRFTEDASANTQDALSEKRKERDELRVGLVRDIENAFTIGTLFHGGQEIQLDGGSDIKDRLVDSLKTIIPHVYSRFSIADLGFDFSKDLKSFINPNVKDLHDIAPDLGLFDTQGNIHKDAPLAEQVIEIIGDLEDEGIDPLGGTLLDARENKGFNGLIRAPFGWPNELVRLILSACFRAGAVYIEQQAASGMRPVYDYHNTGDLFSKINTFKKLSFRIAETSLSVDQIKEANKALITMGVSGTPESGNAIATAIRELGENLKGGIAEAKTRAEQGLPLSGTIIGAEQAVNESIRLLEPTAAIVAFLNQRDAWIELHGSLGALGTFLDDNRHQEFAASRQVADLASNHPIPEDYTQKERIQRALADMKVLIDERTVIERWADYRSAFEQAWQSYRDAYLELYDQVRGLADKTFAVIRESSSYKDAPPSKRDHVIESCFGEGNPCHYPEIQILTASILLDVAAKNSLTALKQALVALPGYRRQIESELQDLVLPPLPKDQVWEWPASERLSGRRLQTYDDVDDFIDEVSEEFRARIKEGATVVIK